MNNLDALERASDEELKKRGIVAAAQIVGRLIQNCGEADSINTSERTLLNRSLAVLERLQPLDNGDCTDTLLVLKMMALGKLGDFDRALNEATQAYQAKPTWQTAVAVANACRRAGNSQRAIEMFSTAAELDPTDVSALLEVGDSYLNMGEWALALAAYERATEREPDQAWATPSLHYCKYRLTGDKKWLQLLQERAEQPPDECGVEGILAQITGSDESDVGIQRAQELLERYRSGE